jgi:hypothetical protein
MIESDKEMLTTLIAEYVPLLQPSAIVVYLHYYLLKDQNNIARIVYTDLQEHTGMASGTISDAIKTLLDYNLIKRAIKTDNPACRNGCYEVVPIVVLSALKRREEYRKAKRVIDTDIRRRALSLSNLPIVYQQLTNVKCLKKALETLGEEQFTLENLIQYFNLDRSKVALWASSLVFKQEFSKAKQEALQKKQELKESKKKTSVPSKTADEMHKSLMKANIKGDQEVPIECWDVKMLFRYFCILYEKAKGVQYVWMPPKDSFNSKELRDMKSVSNSFNKDAKKVAKFLEWVFEVKSKDTKKLPDGILGTGILMHLINEFNGIVVQTNNKLVKVKSVNIIDEDFSQWIKENVSEIYTKYNLSTILDLDWLKQFYDQGVCVPEMVSKVVDEGIKRGILSNGKNKE